MGRFLIRLVSKGLAPHRRALRDWSLPLLVSIAFSGCSFGTHCPMATVAFYCKAGCSYEICNEGGCEYSFDKKENLPQGVTLPVVLIKSASQSEGVCGGVKDQEDMIKFIKSYNVRCKNGDLPVGRLFEKQPSVALKNPPVTFNAEFGWVVDVSSLCTDVAEPHPAPESLPSSGAIILDRGQLSILFV